MDTSRANQADVVASYAEDEPVLVAEVKARPIASGEAAGLLSRLAAHAPASLPYVMLVDPERISIHRVKDGRVVAPVAELRTRSVLSVYEPELDRKPIYHDYLAQLVRLWLTDVAYHWRDPEPPGLGDLRQSGVADALRGADVFTSQRRAA